jgi:hypothetical protein
MIIRKSFENLLSSLTWGTDVGSNSRSGLEEIDFFPEAFPRLRFLLRSQQGSLPPIGKCEGSLVKRKVAAAPCPRLPTFKSF